MRHISIITFIIISLSGCMTFSAVERQSFSFQENRAEIISKKKISCPNVREASGIIFLKDKFYIINDSHNSPSLFILDEEEWTVEELRLTGCRNRDWEDIAVDERGVLLIGDTGNNFRRDRDPVIYSVNLKGDGDEKTPVEGMMTLKRKPGTGSFDAEALFCSGQWLYLITKEKRRAQVFRAAMTENQSGEIILEKMGEIRTEYPVTAADAGDNEILVLTYGSVIKAAVKDDEILLDTVYTLDRKEAGKCEGICYAGERIFAVNEEGYLMELSLR